MRAEFGGFVFGLCLVCTAASVQAQESQPKWGASIDVEGKLGTERHLGEADMLVPLWQDADTLLFGTARYRFDDNESKEGNFGLGLRHMLGEWNLGTYGYFDRRETGNENMFNQLTFGAEALGTDFDARVNSYWPFGDTTKNIDSLSTASISGSSVIFRGGEERALQGFDGEVGWRVPVFQFESPYDFRVYAGGYHFYDADDAAPDVTGPRLRAELTSYEVPYLWQGSRLTLGTEWQTDDVRGGQVFVSARLRIPLQSEAQRNRTLTAQERRMTTPIVRDVDIVAQAGAFGAPEMVTRTASGQTITVLNSDTSGNGSLTDELTTAGNNATVILSGIVNTTQFSQIQAGQTLMGAGTVTVRSPSGRTATLTTPGATINKTGIGSAIGSGAGDNWTVTGLTIVNTNAGGATGIRSNGETGVTISNNTIIVTASTNDATGIDLTNGGSTIVTGNTVTAVSGVGQAARALVVLGNGGTTTVTGNTFSAYGGTTNNHTFLQTATIGSGSTGNTLAASNTGACVTDNGGTGFIGYTNAANCNAF